MKFSTVTGCLAAVSCVNAFSDSGKVYSNWLAPFGSFIESSKLNKLIGAASEDICQSSHKQLFIYRVVNSHLVDDVDSQQVNVGEIHYDSSSNLDFNFNEKCVINYKDSMDEVDSKSNIVIVDLDDKTYNVSSLLASQKNVIIQSKPNFNSKLDDIKYYLKDKFKRYDGDELTSVMDEEVAELELLMEEVDEEFKKAGDLIAAEGDQEISILQDLQDVDSDGKLESTFVASQNKNTNLFTEYQFFTPGLWTCIIVSFFLLAVVYTAIGWLSSVQITYKAFEKQVDYGKKTE